MRRSILILLPLVAITACASRSPYGCPLDANQQHCRSLEEVYSEARTAPKSRKGSGANAGVMPTAALPYHARANADTETQGQPVFQQPRVFRPWLAPYVDADGNLRSGEYVYFATTGEWNYGTTREAGAASSATLFGPQRPGQLGFVPVTPNSQKRPPAPASPGSLPSPPAVTTRDGITQPADPLVTR